MDGSLAQTLAQRAERELSKSLSGLSPEEAAVMAILEQQLKDESNKKVA
jgi:hypothetical protein